MTHSLIRFDPFAGLDTLRRELFDDGTLVIHAERHEREEDRKKTYVLHESSSSFYRRVDLPEQADSQSIKATFRNGVLKVAVPLKGLTPPTKIAIETGSTD
ncbi:Hsp20/alpha crystallin family protein [Nesterenkonia sp. NBAIMH1]|uniref:Hsp20/alpha crystallin family protein n=1 Tax=Nesterenkonia sp. NBAIMH1 TaxID=2600320 RepID=UPI0011B77C6F|nr:Hsp20/alpha crystallin family protein [Nesterenkonia sp. NBAIMH1]